MKHCDCASQHAVNRFLEPLRSVRICECLRTDGQDCGSDSDCAKMNSVHCSVIVDNKSEFCQETFSL